MSRINRIESIRVESRFVYNDILKISGFKSTKDVTAGVGVVCVHHKFAIILVLWCLG